MDVADIPSVLWADLTAWAESDLPEFVHRARHPYLARCCVILRWLCTQFEVQTWTDIRPSHVQRYCKAHPHLKPSTLRAYVKALRRFLRWLERDHLDAPELSRRLTHITPREVTDDPFVIDDETERRLLHRANWIHHGSRTLRFTTRDGRSKLANMRHWQPGAFRLFLLLGLRMGLRPWETAFLRWHELHTEETPPYLQLQPHKVRPLKTPLAGMRLGIPGEVLNALTEYRETAVNRPQWLFATVDGDKVSAPHYDAIWRALREELDIPGLNARCLRRKFASDVRKRTKDIFELATATRHVSLDTLNFYVSRHGGRIVDPLTGKVI